MSAMVVQAVPRPRARAASMKLQVPGSTLPIDDAAIIDGTLSTRPPVQAITSAGASAMWSARYSADSVTRCCWSCSASVSFFNDPA